MATSKITVHSFILGSLSALAAFPPAASGQELCPQLAEAGVEDASAGEGAVRDLQEWQISYDVYEAGFGVDYLFDDVGVVDEDEDAVGNVENLVIGTDGSIRAVIIELEEAWGLFSERVSVPWAETNYSPVGELTITADEENLDDYRLGGSYPGRDSENGASDTFLATELLGDSVSVSHGDDRCIYGTLTDLIADKGELVAMVAEPEHKTFPRSGPYAFPYGGNGESSEGPLYRLPYSLADVAQADQMDYSLLDDR